MLLGCEGDDLQIDGNEDRENEVIEDTTIVDLCLDNFLGTYRTVIGDANGKLTLLNATITIEEIADSFVINTIGLSRFEEIPLLSCANNPTNHTVNGRTVEYEIINENSLSFSIAQSLSMCTESISGILNKSGDTLYYSLERVVCNSQNYSATTIFHEEGFALKDVLTDNSGYYPDLRRYANSSQVIALDDKVYLYNNHVLTQFDTINQNAGSIILEYVFNDNTYNYEAYNHPTNNKLLLLAEIAESKALQESNFLVFDLDGSLVEEINMSSVIGFQGDIIDLQYSFGDFFILGQLDVGYSLVSLMNLDNISKYDVKLDGHLDIQNHLKFSIGEDYVHLIESDATNSTLSYVKLDKIDLSTIESYEISNAVIPSNYSGFISSFVHFKGKNYLLANPSEVRFDESGIEFLGDYGHANYRGDIIFSEGVGVMIEAINWDARGQVTYEEIYLYTLFPEVKYFIREYLGPSNMTLDIEVIDGLFYLLTELNLYIYSEDFNLIHAFLIKN